MSIKITKNELSLLLASSHPEYKTGEPEFLEQGKGADVHYLIPVTRIADNQKLEFTAVHNGDIGGYHDFVQDGDFVVDVEKLDVYDRYGKRIEVKEAAVKAKVGPESFRDVYKELKEKGHLLHYRETFVIPPEKMREIFGIARAFVQKKLSYRDMSDQFLKIGIEYKVEAQRVYGFAANAVVSKKTTKELKDYKREYEAFHGKPSLKSNFR